MVSYPLIFLLLLQYLLFYSRLAHQQYNIITSKIIALFPNECPGSFYVPAVRKCDSPIGRPILAKGKLVDKCKNLIQACGDAVPKQRKRKFDNKETHQAKSSKFDFDSLDGMFIILSCVCTKLLIFLN